LKFDFARNIDIEKMDFAMNSQQAASWREGQGGVE
jgi:hypothetical protein